MLFIMCSEKEKSLFPLMSWWEKEKEKLILWCHLLKKCHLFAYDVVMSKNNHQTLLPSVVWFFKMKIELKLIRIEHLFCKHWLNTIKPLSSDNSAIKFN